MATRDKAADLDFSDFLEEEAESQLKEAGASLLCRVWCMCIGGGGAGGEAGEGGGRAPEHLALTHPDPR